MGNLAGRQRPLVRGAILTMVLFLLAVVLYCCGLPFVTGQACYDFLSGHVPPRALDRFLERVFEAALAEDYAWLATISTAEALEEVRAAQHVVTTDYEVVLSDNLSGLYEYRIRFNNGSVVYVTMQGVWHACPDFVVTDEEIFQNIKLISMEVELDGVLH